MAAIIASHHPCSSSNVTLTALTNPWSRVSSPWTGMGLWPRRKWCYRMRAGQKRQNSFLLAFFLGCCSCKLGTMLYGSPSSHMERPCVGTAASGSAEVPKSNIQLIVMSEQTISVFWHLAMEVTPTLQVFLVRPLRGGREMNCFYRALSEFLTQRIHRHNKVIVVLHDEVWESVLCDSSNKDRVSASFFFFLQFYSILL